MGKCLLVTATYCSEMSMIRPKMGQNMQPNFTFLEIIVFNYSLLECSKKTKNSADPQKNTLYII